MIRLASLAVTCVGLPLANLGQQVEGGSARIFPSAADAIKALAEAAQTKDKSAIQAIFGSSVREMITGDETQDAANFAKFSQAMTARCVPVAEGPSKITLEIGPNQWPFPIPLVHQSAGWFFDTDAGKEEIINRHIGRDELHAIGLCRAYVDAQRQFARQHSRKGAPTYAVDVKCPEEKTEPLISNSTPADSAPALAALLDESGSRTKPKKPDQPYHGYRYKILTHQGTAAPGGKLDYMTHGILTRGFALIAYPVTWGKSGVMTFIVNQDGKLYQRNLGESTASVASRVTEYNPTSEWSLVEDAGVRDF